MMTIDTLFTPWQSLAGGALIGLATVLLMLTLGRIMGATGILAGVLTPTTHPDRGWRLAVLALTGQMPVVQVPVSLPMLLVGGVLVGIGVTYV